MGQGCVEDVGFGSGLEGLALWLFGIFGALGLDFWHSGQDSVPLWRPRESFQAEPKKTKSTVTIRQTVGHAEERNPSTVEVVTSARSGS